MNRQTEVSIIIPVYNGAKTIKRCLESCINQIGVNIECIVADDCSTDDTPHILSEYSARYPQTVKVITQPQNKKQGAARNAAFKIANGEYIFFLDSDDWIDPDVCKTLVELARENDADMVAGNYDILYPERTETVCTYKSVARFLGKMTKEKRERLIMEQGYFWCKLYRRDLIERAFPDGILFPEGVFYEDAYFNTFATLASETVVRTDHICYHYWQNSESTVHRIDNQLDKIPIAKMLIEKSKEPQWREYRDILYYKAAVFVAAALLYGWIPMYKRKSSRILNNSLKEIVTLIPEIRGGGVLYAAQ